MGLFSRFRSRQQERPNASMDWKSCNQELIEHIKSGNIDEAVKLGIEMVDYVDRTYRKDTPEKATTYNNMGMAFMMAGDWELAEQSFKEALQMRKRLFGDDHNEVAVVLLNLAELYRRQARLILKNNPVTNP